MDFNMSVLSGTLSADPEYRTFDSGAHHLRYLVTVRSDAPRRRVDVLPVTLWDPPDELVEDPGVRGEPAWVVASVQRRFWADDKGRNSRLELVAHSVHISREDEGA